MSKAKILIVEDEPTIVLLLKSQLRLLGYEFAGTASTGQEALQKIKKSPPDLILMDVILEGENDGIESASQIKASFEIPVVYITGHSDKSIVERAKLTEPFGYLIKPVGKKELQATIEMALYKHEADKKLKKLTRRLNNTLDSISDGFLTLDKNFIVRYFNKSAEKLLGRKAEEVLGLHLFEEAFKEAKGSVFEEKYRNALKENQFVSFETYFGNSPYENWYEIRVYPYEEGITIYFQVITKRKQLEKQLRHSQKMDALGTMAGGIAHEFNNILAVIQGYSGLLLHKLPEGSPEKSYVEGVHAAGERAANLTRQILTFSRMDDQIRCVQYMAPLIKETLQMMRATTPVTIDIQHDLNVNCPPILADTNQIHQVLINLYNNAFHAMEKTGGVLKVCLQEETYEESLFSKLKTGSYLKLTVSDTGCGIAPGEQERIFDPFFTTKEVGKGTGLGLSVVHSIIDQHDGLIIVESEVNKGTSFHIYFPVAHDDTEEEQKEEITISPGGGHLLIIDDEVTITAVYKEILRDIGYTITVFNDELEALAAFQANPQHFDLVFTDYTMPHLTGDQLSLELLKIRPNIPIVLATGYHSAISESKAKSLGISEFFMKPVDTNKLIQVINRLLGN
ncbi:MAG: response regulator [SAR324 cluster bacterium]|nr:response regulator [SAR324 cluster bacterium]